MNPRLHAMRALVALPISVLAATLAGCGGGTDGPSVSTLAASNVAYGRSMVVTVNGIDLDQGITMNVDEGCIDVARLPGGSAAVQQFSCKVDAVGALKVQVHTTGGERLAQLALEVPPPQVRLVTSMGTIEVELDPGKVKLTVDNFLAYVNEGYYRNVIYHRVDRSVNVIQAGGFSTGLVPKTQTHPPIALESNRGLNNLRGTIGMARTGGQPDSATSQFFFNLIDNPALDYTSEAAPGYAVFGRVTVGMNVVDLIGAVPVETRVVMIDGVPNTMNNVPVDEIVITSATQIR